MLTRIFRYWYATPTYVQRSLVGQLFTLGAGGLFFVAFAAYFGRLPVMLVFQSLSLAFGVWCGTAISFNSYAAARGLNGFFATYALSVYKLCLARVDASQYSA